MISRLLPTTVVGSYPQPSWLIDRPRRSHSVPRCGSRCLARRRAAPSGGPGRRDLAAIREMEEAGIDIITDGDIRRESYSNASRPRWTASTPLSRVHPNAAANPGGPRSSDRSAGGGRSRSSTWSSFAATPTARPRSPCPGPSRWPSRPPTRPTATRTRSSWIWRRRSTHEARALRPPARTSSSSTSPGCATTRGARRIAVPAIDRAFQGRRQRRPSMSASATRRSSARRRPTATSSWRAGRLERPAHLGRGRPAPAGSGQLAELAPKTIMLGVLDLGDPEARRPNALLSASGRCCRMSLRSGSSPLRIAA